MVDIDDNEKINQNFNNLKESYQKIKQNEERANQAALINAEREQARKLQMAKEMDELLKGRIHVDPQGREVTHWEEAIGKANAALNAEVRAYDDWRASMFSLLALFSSLNKALHQSTTETVWHPFYNKAVYGLTIPGIGRVGFLPLFDKFFDLFEKDPPVILASLIHTVDFDDEDKLVIEPLTRSDNNQEIGALDAFFKEGIKMWLEENGYKETVLNSNKYVHDDGTALDKAAFHALKNDPEHGLFKFLTDHSDLSFSPQP